MRDIGMEILIERVQKKYILLYNGMHFSNAQFMLIDQYWIIFFSFLNHALFLSGHSFSTGILDVSVQMSYAFSQVCLTWLGVQVVHHTKKALPRGMLFTSQMQRFGAFRPLQSSKREPTLQLSGSAVILSQPCFRCTLKSLSLTDLYSEA